MASPSDITPNRNTTLTLDRDETVVIEPGVSIMRTGVEVAKRSADKTSNSAERVNVRNWSSGAWTLDPLQSDMSNIYELTTGQAAVIKASAWTFVLVNNPLGLLPMFIDAARQAQSDVAGAVYAASVPTSGDPFLRKSVSAIGTFDPTDLNPSFDASGPPPIPYINDDVPMDRVGFSNATFRANQGFCVRWHSPNIATAHPRYLAALYFGQYGLIIGGSGTFELWEYCYNGAGDLLRWVSRAFIDTGTQGSSPGTAHSVIIYPHTSPEGINFIGFSDISKPSGVQTNARAFLGINNSVHGEHMYKGDPTVRGTDRDMSPGFATMAAQIRLDMRRDLKLDIQVSTLLFPKSPDVGTLIDDDTIAGGGCWTSNPNVPALSLSTTSPGANYTVTGQLVDASGGGAFQPGNTGQDFVNASVFIQPKFTFESTDGNDTPALWGYAIKQLPLIQVASPGAFDLAGQEYSIDFSSGDPSTETATVRVTDLTMVHSRLAKRGRFSALLWGEDTSGNIVRLFQGVCRKPRRTRLGAGRTVPGVQVPDFSGYDLSLYGMWDRLNDGEHFLHNSGPRAYGLDPAADPNSLTTWKVTDVVADCLIQCGFTPSQFNIPDLPYRIWPGQVGKVEDLLINPAASVPDYLVRLIRNYLGAFLHFEPNAGADGQWLLIFGTQPVSPVAFGQPLTFTPLWNFVSTPPNGLYTPDQFPANTSFIKTSPQFYTNAPEFNAIWVSAGTPTVTPANMMQCAAVAVNPLSFEVPDMTTRSNPNHPDYLGYCKPLRLSMPELNVLGTDYSDTFTAVRWTCRRIFDFECHAQQIALIESPLAVIFDPLLGAYRPLRFQDPVTIDGDAGWLIKAPRAHWTFDGVQMAQYECIKPQAGQWFIGHDYEHEERMAFRRASQRTSGMVSRTGMYGMSAHSSHKEAGMFELPFARGGFTSLQYPDGTFIPINGWNTLTGAPG